MCETFKAVNCLLHTLEADRVRRHQVFSQATTGEISSSDQKDLHSRYTLPWELSCGKASTHSFLQCAIDQIRIF